MKWNILLLFSAICVAFSFSSGLPKLQRKSLCFCHHMLLSINTPIKRITGVTGTSCWTLALSEAQFSCALEISRTKPSAPAVTECEAVRTREELVHSKTQTPKHIQCRHQVLDTKYFALLICFYRSTLCITVDIASIFSAPQIDCTFWGWWCLSPHLFGGHAACTKFSRSFRHHLLFLNYYDTFMAMRRAR